MSENPYESPQEGSLQDPRPTRLRQAALPILFLLSIPTALVAFVGATIACLMVGTTLGLDQDVTGAVSAVVAMLVAVGSVMGVLLFGANMLSDHESG